MFFPFGMSAPMGGPETGAAPSSTPIPIDFRVSGGGPELGIGISSLPDLDDRFLLVDGNRNLGEALARRLETPRGGLFYAPDYGTDLRGRLNDSLTEAQLFALQSEVEAEVEKDERVLSASAEVSFDSASGALTVELQVSTASGPFRLVLGVDQVTVALLEAQ